jgi:hypothetical protein
MNNYKKLQDLASDLKSDYKKLTDFEALSIAASLLNTEAIQDGLLVNSQHEPVAIEAIAMVL